MRLASVLRAGPATAPVRGSPERAALASLRAAGPFVQCAVLVLLGYAVMGRSFAQIGLAGAGLFIGEVCLAATVAYRPVRSVLFAGVEWSARPHELHAVVFSAGVLLLYGMVEVARGVAAGYPPVEALKNLAFNYYPIVILIGIATAAAFPDLLRVLAVVLPWVNAAYIVVFLLILRHVRIDLPLSSAPGLSSGLGTVASIALLVSHDDLLRRRWYVFVANLFCLLFLQVRGDWLATIVGVALWASLRQRWRSVVATLVLGTAALVFVAALDIRIPGGLDRGGSVSATEVVARAVAPFDEQLAGSLSSSSQDFAGTAEWRKQWWSDIWASSNSSATTAFVGHGYGFPLYSLTWFLRDAEAPIRTPHSVFFYTLGFTGWFGVAFFAALHLAVGMALWRAYRSTGNTFGPMLWLMVSASSLFGNFFETPFNAAPYWFLVGAAIASSVRNEVRARMVAEGYRPAWLGQGPSVTERPR